MFDFRRITLFSLEKRLSKHKMNIFSKHLVGLWPLSPPPGYAYAITRVISVGNLFSDSLMPLYLVISYAVFCLCSSQYFTAVQITVKILIMFYYLGLWKTNTHLEKFIQIWKTTFTSSCSFAQVVVDLVTWKRLWSHQTNEALSCRSGVGNLFTITSRIKCG